jgi:hypothetical protein
LGCNNPSSACLPSVLQTTDILPDFYTYGFYVAILDKNVLPASEYFDSHIFLKTSLILQQRMPMHLIINGFLYISEMFMTARYPNTAEKALTPQVPAVGWRHQKRYGLCCGGPKRGLDVLAVLFSLPVILPLIVRLALPISMDGHSPLYRQKRLGNNGRIVTLRKLRSMVAGADTRLETYLSTNPAARAEWTLTRKLKNDPCITGIGRVLRKSSADDAGTGAALTRNRLLRAAPRDHRQLAGFGQQ